MKDNFVGGNILTIPEDTINNIVALDAQINKIAEDSENMKKKFSGAMTNMTLNTDSLLKKLIEVHSYMVNMGNINVGNVSNINGLSTGLSGTATNAEKAAQNISRAAIAINSLSESLKSSGVKNSVLRQIDSLAATEQANAIKELKNQAQEMSRTLAQLNKENALEAKKKANETKIASQEEQNATLKKMGFLKEEGNLIRINTSELSRYASAMALSEATEDSRLKKIERLRSIHSEMNKDEAKYAEQLKIISQKIETLTKENERFAEARRKAAKEKLNLRSEVNEINAYNKAMSASEVSINQKLNKIVKLKYAQDLLTKSERDYSNELKKIKEELDRINKAYNEQLSQHKKVRNSHRRLMDTAGQLARKLALIFSVSQIQGYLMNIVQVTGEFEKQNTALASILQNKDKADKLFGQITQLAVKSPFQLKELLTYTKSLSAYQVEYEKLFDTTKRLADVSAGLGIDMQRLILAFGQVKSANYLRGTEVRQFTEGGLNILGELSKYYTELENRMVSVGEVQERVTKRMVSFGDVEEIFKRVTSAGGIFYKMQETQAETIAGQMSNLRDSIDIMLNDIGSANSDTIKEAIGSVRALLQNWRDLAFSFKVAALELSPVIAYMVFAKAASTGLGKAVTLLGKYFLISTGMMKGAEVETEAFSVKAKLATFWTNTWKTALKGFTTLGVGLAIGAIVYGIEKLIVDMTRASRQAKELKEKLSSLLNSGEYEAAKLSNRFRQLADTILDSSTSIDKQNEALEELKRTYKEILPEELLKIENLKALKGNYDAVTRAIYDKVQAQVKEKQITAVSETYGRDVEVAFDKVKEILQREQRMLPADAAKVATAYRIALEKGEIEIGADYTAFVENIINENYKMNSKIRTAFRETAVTTSGGATTFIKTKDVSLQNTAIENLAESVFKLREELDKIKGVQVFPWSGSEYDALQKELEKQKEIIREARRKVAEENEEKGSFFISEAQNKKEKEIIQSWINSFKGGLVKIKDAYNNIVDPTSTTSAKFIEDLQKQLDSIDGNKMQKEVLGVVRAFSKLNDISLVDFNRVFMKSTQSMGDYKKQIESDIKDIEERFKQHEKGYSGYITNIFNEDDKKKAEQTLALIKAIQTALFPVMPKDKGSRGNPELRKLNEQISLIKKAGEEYKKLIKYYEASEAKEKVMDSFKDAFGDLNLSVDMDFDTEGVIKGIESLTNKVGEDGKKAIDKALSDQKTQIGIEVRQEDLDKLGKDIENAFSSYEIFLDLKNEGLDKDLISQLFNINILSLDGLKAKIQSLKPEVKEGMEKFVEEWEKAEKKVTKIEADELQKRLVKYASYLKKSITERENIELDYGKQISEVSDSDKFTSEQKDAIIAKLKKEKQKALDSLTWKEFKETDEYIQLFDEMEYMSTRSINKMRDKLIGLRDSLKELTPEQLKEILAALKKIDDLSIKRNPFKGLFSKDVKESSKSWSELGNILQDVSNTAGSVASSLENVFGTMSDKARDAIESFQEISQGVGDMASGVGRFMAGDYIGGALQAVKGLAGTIGAIFNIGDKKKERQIKKQIELVENLKESYERLREAIDKAYSSDELKRGTEQMNANLEARNAALQTSIKAEEDKKKTDHDRIKEWQKEIEVNNKQIAENNKQLLQSVGGFGTDDRIKSAAEEFAQSWLDAYLEVGDGLEGLQGKMIDWLKNAVQKQLLVNLSKEFITPVLEQFDQMFKEGSVGGTAMTPEEAEAWKDLYESKSEEFNKRAEAYLEALKAAGIDLGKKPENDKMGGLQKGIQGITEQTAEALEAITESIRFFAADSNMQLKTLVNAVINPPIENPFITELKAQTELMRMTYSLWSGLVKSKSGVSGKVMRVEIV